MKRSQWLAPVAALLAALTLASSDRAEAQGSGPSCPYHTECAEACDSQILEVCNEPGQAKCAAVCDTAHNGCDWDTDDNDDQIICGGVVLPGGS